MSGFIKLLLSLTIMGGLVGVLVAKTKAEKPIKLMLVLIVACAALSAFFNIASQPLFDDFVYDSGNYQASSVNEVQKTVEEQLNAMIEDFGSASYARAVISDDYTLEKVIVYGKTDEQLIAYLKDKTGFQNIVSG